MKSALALLGLFVGVFAMIFGEFDDSPGVQGLGMLLIIFILYQVSRCWRKSKKR